MKIEFYKYQGTGNDFIIIDDRDSRFNANNIAFIQKLCDRKFGIGSDGLILIQKSDKADFTMDFYNPDGSKSFCGNGSRCAVQFCFDQKIISGDSCSYEAIDGIHQARIEGKRVLISLNDVGENKKYGNDLFIHTGSPHYIRYVDAISSVDVKNEGAAIRNREEFKPGGTNVNFVELNGEGIKVRTYERGVENETLSCGSGVTACALSAALMYDKQSPVKVKSQGGNLEVTFKREGENFSDIYLAGPAEFVFKGEIDAG